VVLGFAGLDGYLAHPEPYLGALVGRYANRIAGGRFTLDGRTYLLARNNGPNCLHGGERGFDKRVWDVTPVEHGVRLSRVSPDGEEGFPGRLEVSATYTLDATGALRIAYEAVTDAPTVVSLTNHSYFRLDGSGAAGGHRLRLAASRYTPVDADLVPTGVYRAATDCGGRPPGTPRSTRTSSRPGRWRTSPGPVSTSAGRARSGRATTTTSRWTRG
jgi:aldose 1-epimerase